MVAQDEEGESVEDMDAEDWLEKEIIDGVEIEDDDGEDGGDN